MREQLFPFRTLVSILLGFVFLTVFSSNTVSPLARGPERRWPRGLPAAGRGKTRACRLTEPILSYSPRATQARQVLVAAMRTSRVSPDPSRLAGSMTGECALPRTTSTTHWQRCDAADPYRTNTILKFREVMDTDALQSMEYLDQWAYTFNNCKNKR